MKKVLQKYIAESGYCSRRKAEELIRQSVSAAAGENAPSVETRHASSLRTGQAQEPRKRQIPVLVNGQAPELGMKVGPEDEVTVYGKKISLANDLIYIILNKPKGYTCTNRKFEKEKNIFELVKTDERLFAVGRLDKDSRGLVLLTNDGELADKMTHPRYKHEKEYEVMVGMWKRDGGTNKGEITVLINKLKKGIVEGGEAMKAKRVEYAGEGRFLVVLTQGKKRQIRRMFRGLGLQVTDLKRARLGSLLLGDLKEGKWRHLEGGEVKGLRK